MGPKRETSSWQVWNVEVGRGRLTYHSNGMLPLVVVSPALAVSFVFMVVVSPMPGRGREENKKTRSEE